MFPTSQLEGAEPAPGWNAATKALEAAIAAARTAIEQSDREAQQAAEEPLPQLEEEAQQDAEEEQGVPEAV